jgi:hypothetical protein
MTTITVYPAVGLTVLAQDGVTVIPTSGAIVQDNDYYRDLLRRGWLLTYDPLDTDGDPIEIPSGDSATLLQTAIAVAVATPGTLGEVRIVEAEGVSFDVISLTGAATVDGVDVFATFADRHWARRKTGRAPMARSTGPRCNGSFDDTAGLENAINKVLRTPGACLKFQSGDRVRITDTLEIDSGGTSLIETSCMIDGGSPSGTVALGAKIFYDGTHTDRPAFRLRARDFTFRGITLEVANGRSATALLELDMGSGGTPYATSRPTFENVGFGAYPGQVPYGIITAASAAGNLEEARFYNCITTHFYVSHFRFLGGQPYGFRIVDHVFHQEFLSVLGVPTVTGACLLFDSGSCSVTVDRPTVMNMTYAVFNEPAGLVTTGYVDTEYCKRWLHSGAAVSPGRPVATYGGRFASNSYGVPAQYPTIAADDDDFVKWGLGGSPLHFVACEFAGERAVRRSRRKFSVARWCDITFDSCTLPHDNQLVERTDSVVGSIYGGHYRRGCRVMTGDFAGQADPAPDDIPVQHAPDLDGCNNHSFEFTHTGPVTTIVWQLLNEESAADSYRVIPTITARTGSAPTTSVRVTAQTATQFTLALAGGAPGTDTITIACEMRLRGDVPQSIVPAMHCASPTTDLGSPAGTGIMGHPSGFWVGGTFHLPALPGGTRTLWGAGISADSGWRLEIESGGNMRGEVYGAAVISQSTISAASGIAKSHAWMLVFDGAVARLYLDGVVGTTGASITHVPGTLETAFGSGAGSGNYNYDVPVYGLVGGNGVPTSDERALWFATVRRGNVLPSIAGKTDHRWPCGGSAPINDTVGSAHMTLIAGGAPIATAIHPAFTY